ncbi:TlpA family protein disulfide reductase [Desulfoprunum benzoelyticum]|uniref:Thiol-disulfide isomerase/thioredoxin n=1 Tax=Desulfoprunum benzoelyticum TaxID=1506996 RepID=A0A840V5Y8_9BACT|nr:TlpA disulfide reductase family protein [Desulfoprunum benzoelyticum]MBB5349169.1 thiol-disulfide isomerase/thioredoxin [Desulfoprunum benzoelyticum]MBM9530594.1 TlpA family protein disulfide reductase [Desulfoprunum benzoelyticum]
MKKILKTLVIIICAAVIGGSALVPAKVLASTKMPAFALEDVRDGQRIDSDSFEGKALLITFFATWCPPCLQEIPALVKLQNEFGPNGFSVVALSVDQGGRAEVAELVEQQAINYPVLMADAATAENFGGVYGIPVSFLVNKSGNVVKRYPGLVPHSVMAKDVQSLIE